MASNKYIGYVGGAAIAAGVGAAIAVAGQGTAHADADGSKPASSESKSSATAKDAKSEKKTSNTAGPKRTQTKAAADSTAPATKPKFDPAGAIDDLKKQFTGAKLAATEPADVVVTDGSATPSEATTPTVITPVVETGAKSAATPLADLATKAAEAAAVLVKPLANASSAASVRMAAATADTWYVPNTSPVPWDLNPFRFGDPIPEGMPDVIWQLEKGVVDLFNPIPIFQPLVREGFEFGYRVSQIIPWVNIVLPLSNVVAQFPNLTSGDPVLFKTATQSIINNLLVTLQPVAILFYGYDELADVFNLEYQGQQLKDWFYTSSWDLIDFFGLLHNKGESGLPLSSTPAGSSEEVVTPDDNVALAASYAKSGAAPAAAVAAAAVSNVAATTDAQGSDPFRADDPWPTDMPASVLDTEKAIVAALPAAIAPIVREAYEAVYRASQVIPYVNVPIPVSAILQALASGGGTAVQTTVNQLLLTTQPVSLLYYGFDEVVDLLNIEDQGYALKQSIYATLWDLADPSGALHVPGTSGI
ncbi:hypothetical protein [Mycolicibacterium komossense]|uniref:PE-PPE domain-containing protein n=1 Tax=Mycolicibacterium komossense TaxID=1779 RepID=A0ABT3CFW7_9MYCO|nr:hypothetical protein [Mycolicibacterium komossense]MCV7228282.1 hypothetical protein [Mycolicibacterium komossense]